MATLFKEVGYSLSLLIENIEMGDIGLPEIQRPFVWPNSKVRDLFDSMYRGFPIGYLLFWINGFSEVHRQIGTNVKQKVPRLLIVDGQQRLTSLYAVMKGIAVVRKDYSQERIYIAFRPRDQKFEVTDAATRRDPEFISDISQLWSGSLSRNRFVKGFIRRLGDHRPLSEDEEDELSENIDRLYNLQNYPFRALELSSAVDEENVAEVFVRINSKGTTLNQADFILTLMSVFWDEGRTELEYFCRDARQPSTSAGSPYNYFIQPDPDQLLRVSIGLGFRRARLRHVYSILRGKDLETEEFSDDLREQQFAVLKEAQGYALNLQNWHEFLKVLMRAGFRRGKMISSQNALLYTYALFLIGKRDYGIDSYTLRNTMARWFFMASLTGRYTGSPETKMEQDLALLRGVSNGQTFVQLVNRIIIDTFTEDYWNINLPNALATSSARSPSLFAYYAALNLLEARVLFSKMKVSELLDPALKGTKAAIERHHLFPRAFLRTLGLTSTRDTNQIANYALVEWSDNINISDKSPSEYFPQYAARFAQRELDEMMYWHALPQGWEEMEYLEFLEARRKQIARVIRDGFFKLNETLGK
ncbi:MAG TPA: DUF262 domain-containing protein [Thermoflexia bacterium]|nr:DUF262 domain-containing protein [Thermoflexia bacterium]